MVVWNRSGRKASAAPRNQYGCTRNLMGVRRGATFIICPFIVCTFIPGESAGIWILRIVISRLVRVAIARRRPYGRGTIRGR